MDHKTKSGGTDYRQSRKSMIDAYNVAAATNPEGCKPRVIDETKPAPTRRPARKPALGR